MLVGKKDPEGKGRLRARDRGKALTGKSTLNRLELTAVGANAGSRYKKIVGYLAAMQNFLVDAFILQEPTTPSVLILDLDATDAVIHGHQLGRFFHGYYDAYCYLPRYIFCGDHPLLALLRPSNIDACTGALRHVQRIVAQLRARWPNMKIISPRRQRLLSRALDALVRRQQRRLSVWPGEKPAVVAHPGQGDARGEAAVSTDRRTCPHLQRLHLSDAQELEPRTACSRQGRTPGQGGHPRFVVTALAAAEAAYAMQPLYENVYCGHGNMENRTKEQQLFLFADRVMRDHACQPDWLNLSTVAYIVLRALRQYGLAQTELAVAQCDTIRLKLLKVGAVITFSVRRVAVALSEAFPLRKLFGRVVEQLQGLPVLAWPPLPIPTG